MHLHRYLDRKFLTPISENNKGTIKDEVVGCCFHSFENMMKASLFFIVGLFANAHAIQFLIKNNAGGEIWVGIQGNPDHEHLNGGGFKLAQGAQVRTQFCKFRTFIVQL